MAQARSHCLPMITTHSSSSPICTMYKESDVKISVTGEFTKLRNLVTDEAIIGQAQTEGGRRGRQGGGERRVSFNVHLLPHSYAVFAAEKGFDKAMNQQAPCV